MLFFNYMLILISAVLIGSLVLFLLTRQKPKLYAKLQEFLNVYVLAGGGAMIFLIWFLNIAFNPYTSFVDVDRSVTVITQKQVKTVTQDHGWLNGNSTFVLKDGQKIKAQTKLYTLGTYRDAQDINISLFTLLQGKYQDAKLVKVTFDQQVPSDWVPFKSKTVKMTRWVSKDWATFWGWTSWL